MYLDIYTLDLPPATVATRTIIFLVGDSFEPSFESVTGLGGTSNIYCVYIYIYKCIYIYNVGPYDRYKWGEITPINGLKNE